ncbi:unnamed protein product [Ostreobium quekettii]|uniref:Uncharacterized protein n=1 Tax=Ostreobium quekettii TaxID=121088 RepID=A0A8S1JD02_9CHLO|nr:unnamed protein product [Ostreobium quekettii]
MEKEGEGDGVGWGLYTGIPPCVIDQPSCYPVAFDHAVPACTTEIVSCWSGSKLDAWAGLDVGASQTGFVKQKYLTTPGGITSICPAHLLPSMRGTVHGTVPAGTSDPALAL